MLEEPVHFPVVERQVLRVDDRLEEEVGFLQLVIEEEIVLRKGESVQIVLLDHLGAEHVQSGEEPAAAGGFLVGASLGFYDVGKMKVHLLAGGVGGQGVDGRSIEGVAEGLIGCGGAVAFADLGKERLVDPLSEGVEAGGKGQAECQNSFHMLCLLGIHAIR